VDFEQHFFSEVQPLMSVPLEDVANSITRNGICLKGTNKQNDTEFHNNMFLKNKSIISYCS